MVARPCPGLFMTGIDSPVEYCDWNRVVEILISIELNQFK